MAGISNATVDQIRLAHHILDGRLVSVQNQYSPAFRTSEPELRACEELGIAFLPWSPLGGISNASTLGSAHSAFGDIARALETSPQQVTVAWTLATSPVIIPIPGSSSPDTIRDSAAADLQLTPQQIAALDAG